MLGGGSTSLSQ